MNPIEFHDRVLKTMGRKRLSHKEITEVVSSCFNNFCSCIGTYIVGVFLHEGKDGLDVDNYFVIDTVKKCLDEDYEILEKEWCEYKESVAFFRSRKVQKILNALKEKRNADNG